MRIKKPSVENSESNEKSNSTELKYAADYIITSAKFKVFFFLNLKI